MQSTSDVLSGPLTATPRRFQVLLWSGVALVLIGYGLLLDRTPELNLSVPRELVGFVMLAGLVLLADLYPLLPWMRDVRANVTFAWSAALSLAAVLVYGPAASVLFPGQRADDGAVPRVGAMVAACPEHGDLRHRRPGGRRADRTA